jgi:hypothetical protein
MIPVLKNVVKSFAPFELPADLKQLLNEFRPTRKSLLAGFLEGFEDYIYAGGLTIGDIDEDGDWCDGSEFRFQFLKNVEIELSMDMDEDPDRIIVTARVCIQDSVWSGRTRVCSESMSRRRWLGTLFVRLCELLEEEKFELDIVV